MGGENLSCVINGEIEMANIKGCNSHYIKNLICNKQDEKIEASECSFVCPDWLEAMDITNKPSWSESKKLLTEQ